MLVVWQVGHRRGLVVRLPQFKQGLEMVIGGSQARSRRHAMLYMAVTGVCDGLWCRAVVAPLVMCINCAGLRG